MPVFNAERWLRQSILSILMQDFQDFELIILDDGSTDGCPKILRSIKDRRLAVYSYERNEGYSRRLNDGIQIASGQFIARMDADDYSIASRFSSQLKCFHADPLLSILGTWTYQIDAHGRLIGEHRCLTSNSAVAIWLLGNVTLVHHPTVMIRRTALEPLTQYNVAFEPAEDFEMWTRAILHGVKIEIVPQHLLLYRRHSGQVSSVRKCLQWEAGRVAVLKMLIGMSNGGLDPYKRRLAFSFLSLEQVPSASKLSHVEPQIPDILLEIRELVGSRFQRAALAQYWSFATRAVGPNCQNGTVLSPEACCKILKEASHDEGLGRIRAIVGGREKLGFSRGRCRTYEPT
jgi:glycosyltransferase involved in cell wall biosynthesis